MTSRAGSACSGITSDRIPLQCYPFRCRHVDIELLRRLCSFAKGWRGRFEPSSLRSQQSRNVPLGTNSLHLGIRDCNARGHLYVVECVEVYVPVGAEPALPNRLWVREVRYRIKA